MIGGLISIMSLIQTEVNSDFNWEQNYTEVSNYIS